MKNINLGKKEVVHFIGIGGIGMSGLAQIMKIAGFNVQGSDIALNKNIDNCKKIGIKIFIGHSKKNINKATIIVKSSAIKNNNQEIKFSRKKKIPIYERAEILADIVSLKKNIVVTGSHGKTTTTSLIAKILSDAKLDPTIINGGVINSIKNNAKMGKGEWSVLEADESDGSFLKFPVHYSIVTNIDYEHLDFYKNFNNLKNAFIKFINRTPSIGKNFICLDDKYLKKIKNKVKNKNISTFGFHKESNYRILNVKYQENKTSFDIITKKKLIGRFSTNLLGTHNVLNTAAAISLCLNIGIKVNVIKKSLLNFSGVQRRMTKVFSRDNQSFYDDYAHHPTEIVSVLDSVKKVNKKNDVIAIFQPHRFSRVKKLYSKFCRSFFSSDKVILCPVYPAGEKIDKKFDIIKFAKKIGKYSKVQVIVINNYIELMNYFKKNQSNKQIIIGMGAGSISKWILDLKEDL